MKQNYLIKHNAKDLKDEVSCLFKHPRLEFNSQKAALLVLDMQNFFKEPSSHAHIPSFSSIIPPILALINSFEKLSRPVIFTKHVNNAENAGLMETWWKDVIKNDDIISDLNTENHLIIEKFQYDAFYNTALEAALRQLNVENVVITGVMTHLCCETTARSAFVRGFGSFFAVDATATYNETFHRNSVYNLAHGFSVPVLAEEVLENFF